MLVGLEKQRIAEITKGHAFRPGFMQRLNFRRGGEARALAVVGRRFRCVFVAHPKDGADDVAREAAQRVLLGRRRDAVGLEQPCAPAAADDRSGREDRSRGGQPLHQARRY
jgi:hypothetical protein